MIWLDTILQGVLLGGLYALFAAGLSLVIARRVTGKAVSSQDALPFGVFLAIGIWLTWLYGPLGLISGL